MDPPLMGVNREESEPSLPPRTHEHNGGCGGGCGGGVVAGVVVVWWWCGGGVVVSPVYILLSAQLPGT